MTASPDDQRGSGSALPRRTARSSAISDAAAGKRARPASNSGGAPGTAGARRAAAIPASVSEGTEAVPADPSSAYADGFAAGLAFAPFAGSAPASGPRSSEANGEGGSVGSPTPPARRRRKGLLAGAVLAGVLLLGVPVLVLLIRGLPGADGKNGAESVASTGTGPGDGSDADPAGSFDSAPASVSPSPSGSVPGSPKPSDAGSASPSGSRATGGATKNSGAGTGTSATRSTTKDGSSGGTQNVAIESYASGRCIDITDGSSSDGTRLRIWDCNGAARQKWTFMSDGTIRALGKCMDVNGGSRDDTAWIQLVTCNGTGAQQFTLNSAHDLVNLQAGKCVDVTDSQTVNGTYLQQWTCTGGSNQKWRTTG
jgi:hypothetical protein